jgi:hypothetical protein
MPLSYAAFIQENVFSRKKFQSAIGSRHSFSHRLYLVQKFMRHPFSCLQAQPYLALVLPIFTQHRLFPQTASIYTSHYAERKFGLYYKSLRANEKKTGQHTLLRVSAVRQPTSKGDRRDLEARAAQEAVGHLRKIIGNRHFREVVSSIIN